MARATVEHVLSVTNAVDTLDEALTFAVQELDRHDFKPGTYLIEITSVTEDDDGDDDVYFEVTVQGSLANPGGPP